MRNMIRLVTLLLAAASAVLIDVVQATHTTFKDCWMLFGGLDDVGWTHAHNLGRLDINQHLRDKYPNSTFLTQATPGTFFMSPEDRQVVIDRYIAEGCNVIYAASVWVLNGNEDELVKTYSNISWIIQTDVPRFQPDYAPPNLIEPELLWFPPSFVAGAVAATFSDTCGAFINAIETCLNCFKHAMGFTLGYRWVKPHQKVHVVTMGGYYNPDGEVQAARQLVEKHGCDVFGRHTDPNDVDKYLYNLPGKHLSIARYIDMSTFVGDTVFTSQMVSFFDWLLLTMESSFRSAMAGEPGPMYDLAYPLEDKAPMITTTSMTLAPFTSIVDNNKAEEVKKVAWEYLESNNPMCGARYRVDGEGNGTLLPVEEGESCPETRLYHLDTVYPLSYLELPNVTYHDAFEDGGAICGGGEYYTYDDHLVLTCHPCPANTFRLETGRSEEECVPCEEGTVSEPGSTLCSLSIKEDKKFIHPGVRAYGYFLVALIAGTAIGFSCWVHYYRLTRIVRASQPLFLHIFCAGCLFLGVSIVPLTIDDSVTDIDGCNKACISFPWLLSLGFCTSFSALFSKIWRINRVMKAASRCMRVKIEAKDVLIPLLSMGSINLILLTLWSILDPPTWSRVPTNNLGSSYGTCWSNWGPASATFATLLVILNLVAVIFANIQAYHARNLTDDLSESKYIALAMASILQILLVGLPLSVLVYDDPTAFFFVVSSVILVISMSLLLLIFVPKIYSHQTNRRRSGITSVPRWGVQRPATRATGRWGVGGGVVTGVTGSNQTVRGSDPSGRMGPEANRMSYGFNLSHVSSEVTDGFNVERESLTAKEIEAAANANSLQRKLHIAEGKISELENLLGKKKPNHRGDKTSQPHKTIEFGNTTLTEISEIGEDESLFRGDSDDECKPEAALGDNPNNQDDIEAGVGGKSKNRVSFDSAVTFHTANDGMPNKGNNVSPSEDKREDALAATSDGTHVSEAVRDQFPLADQNMLNIHED